MASPLSERSLTPQETFKQAATCFLYQLACHRSDGDPLNHAFGAFTRSFQDVSEVDINATIDEWDNSVLHRLCSAHTFGDGSHPSKFIGLAFEALSANGQLDANRTNFVGETALQLIAKSSKTSVVRESRKTLLLDFSIFPEYPQRIKNTLPFLKQQGARLNDEVVTLMLNTIFSDHVPREIHCTNTLDMILNLAGNGFDINSATCCLFSATNQLATDRADERQRAKDNLRVLFHHGARLSTEVGRPRASLGTRIAQALEGRPHENRESIMGFLDELSDLEEKTTMARRTNAAEEAPALGEKRDQMEQSKRQQWRHAVIYNADGSKQRSM